MDNQANNGGIGDPQAAATLQAMTQELKNLQQTLIVQLAQDISRLQAEKSQLVDEINRLRSQHQQVLSQQTEALSQRQVAQQQLWAKQLAQAVAAHLQEILVQQVSQLATHAQPASSPSSNGYPISSSNGYGDNAYRLLASLDATFSSTFKTLQQELNSYQSSLSQQLSEMHNLEQQGTTIMEALVTRLREQLQADALRQPLSPPGPTPAPAPALTNGYTTYAHSAAQPVREPLRTAAGYSVPHLTPSYSSSPALGDAGPTAPAPSEPATKAAPAKPLSNVKLGIILVLLSTLALSVHNVVVGVIGNPSKILGVLQLGGFIKLGLGNSLLMLWVRMLVVVPLMAFIAGILYPPVWRDIKKFLLSRDRKPLWIVLGSGGFLFLSQVLIYIAIGDIGPGIAVTILFMYPIVTVPLAWFFFGDRPTALRVGVLSAVSLGVILAALPRITAAPPLGRALGAVTSVALGHAQTVATKSIWLGIGTAVISGIAFALYLIFMQLGFKKLHPVPVSLMQFSTIFVLSSLSLMLPVSLGVEVLPDNRGGFLVGGLILGILTLVGYLSNNFGVRYIGAGRAAIIASSGPVVTALLAFLLVPSVQNTLQPVQILGILLVTLGVTALSFEKMRTQPKPAPKPGR